MTPQSSVVTGSFRDPSGFVFKRDGVVYRQINHTYRDDYDQLLSSGLYAALVQHGQLIPHTEVETQYALTSEAYKVIQPAQISFISYPYEWCFSELKQAALLTLDIQRQAFEFGLSLKDSSAYNIQFLDGRPILIDTLSFERYRPGEPWTAYRQFCQHFLAPLALMSTVDVRLSHLLRIYLDGIPLDLASKLLPARTKLNFGLLTHLHLHANAQQRLASTTAAPQRGNMGRIAFQGLIDSLRSAASKLTWQPRGIGWEDYYATSNYTSAAMADKQRLVAEMLDKITPRPASAWDIGANTGLFSRIAAERGIPTIAFDLDAAAVEQNYLTGVAEHVTHILPLVLDWTNPSPGIGWGNQERLSLVERGPAEVVLALAVIHHLVIANNVPLRRVADFFAQICRWLIVEFVPKEDEQVQKLLAFRADIFSDYSPAIFEREFGERFEIQAKAAIAETDRTLYLMVARGVA